MKLNKSIKNIGFTCDILRFSIHGKFLKNDQYKNLNWLYYILGANKWHAHGVKVEKIIPSQGYKNLKQLTHREIFFREYTSSPEKAWANLYDSTNIDIFPDVFEKLSQQDLIIGFEIPPSIKRWLNGQKILYISFNIHPIRFLKDLCLTATSNSPLITNYLLRNCISENHINFQIRKYIAQFSRAEYAAFKVPSDLPMLIGQTQNDSVLIKNGIFDQWENHEEELHSLTKLHKDLIFLPHPYGNNNYKIIDYFRTRLNKTIFEVKSNSYGVLFTAISAQGEIHRTITLASSLGVEAEAIGYKSSFLLADPRKKFIVPGVDIPQTPILSHHVLLDEFWINLFSENLEQVDTVGKKDFPLGDDFIRDSLDSWSYKSLINNLPPAKAIKTIAPATGVTNEKINKAINSLCGIGKDDIIFDFSTGEIDKNGVHVLILPPPIQNKHILPLNTDIGKYYLVSGFHTPESWGVWSSSHKSCISIPVARKKVNNTYKLEINIKIKIFDGIFESQPTLNITTENGDVLSSIVFVNSQIQIVNFFMDLNENISTALLYFYLSHVESPLTLGISSDSRTLGFGIESFDVAVVKKQML
ncbi:hypothetical protein [Chromobacterium violaceum]|uniref:hypothetical protein n=1 Tax=Chromobacterium violaceum TaxID=536 RepID=UPI001B332D04|nr:hypothetical protein [Chromobacterium violaceum]MBP4044682.1 hypothetical protein [Chromobacterium violaceum]